MVGLSQTPRRQSYDVVIIGGAIMGASVAWFLVSNPGFDGRILVVERDPTYRSCSTAHTNSCLRQQFSAPINVKISRFAAAYVRRFRDEMGDARVPPIDTQYFGYMYLAGDEATAARLRANAAMQAGLGAGTRILSPDQIAAAYPFYNLDGILLGSHNPVDEGYFDGGTMFDWWRRLAAERGVEFVHAEAVGIDIAGDRATGVRLASGETVACGWVVNAAGPRAAGVAAMAGIALPVEPRKRYTWVVRAAHPLDRDLPLTVDPTGVHFRSDGACYMIGATPEDDPAVAPDDFGFDQGLWERKVWPAVAERIPQFETLKVVNEWVGHYAYNTLDRNAVVGPDDRIGNFLFVNGFSGHGLQQSPAMGRGIAEWITAGGYETLDLSPLHIDRIRAGQPLGETAII
jgi:glycine/D-amino acid oxidase-like deaminating enzyme